MMSEEDNSGRHLRRFRVGVRGGVAISLVVAAIAGGLAVAATHRGTGKPKARRPKVVTSAHDTASHHRAARPVPLRLDSVTPRPGARSVAFAADVTLRFSTSLAPGDPAPQLRPAVPGTWAKPSPNVLVFHPTGNYAPGSVETLVVPGGRKGLKSTTGTTLASTLRERFTVRSASVLRLQQLLAELGYLPVRFLPSASSTGTPAGGGTNAQATAARLSAHIARSGSPSSGTSAPSGSSSATTSTTAPPTTTATQPATASLPGPPGNGTVLSSAPATPATVINEPTVASDIPLAPLPGSFSWRFSDVPPSLAPLWTPGAYGVMTEGAVMQFELAHGLATDGVAGPLVWAALLKAVAHRQVDTAGYDYVFVDTGSPEYVNLWRNGKVIFQSLANTGIAQAPTAVGTWPVYERFTVTTMSGTNPNGTTYHDPGIPWVSYFHGGDALHGFLRAAYGFPQSLGCVEMPYSSAKTLFPYTPIGTLVTIL
jgi:peptidoglycan hydrolase-like protein with peptidoglycan-binding domain